MKLSIADQAMPLGKHGHRVATLIHDSMTLPHLPLKQAGALHVLYIPFVGHFPHPPRRHVKHGRLR